MAVYLTDSNVLVVAADLDSPDCAHVRKCLRGLVEAGNGLCVSGQNLIEFWVVATRPKENNGLGWEPERTAAAIRRILEEFRILEDTPEIFEYWFDLVQSHGVRGKRVHDARLVAVMKMHGLVNLLTFNVKDFKQFDGIRSLNPRDWVAELK